MIGSTETLALQLHDVPDSGTGYSLVLHAGAGGRVKEIDERSRCRYEAGLEAAYRAGEGVLEGGGSALDAVCAAVRSLEDNPLFNAGRGAALTAGGRAELDASVMTGDGRAGAVAVSRCARNPVLAARAVMERSEHVLLVSPGADAVAGWGLETVEPDYFVTEARREQLARVRAELVEGPRHGTVGAVAVDRGGHVAAATSTGGIVNQADGRVGDTPLIGAGTFAMDGVAGVSCTGEGEAFIRAVVAHDVVSRMRYLGIGAAQAARTAIEEGLTARAASGGLIVARPGGVVVAHNSAAMFAAFRRDGRIVTLI